MCACTVFGMLLGDSLLLDTLEDASSYRQEVWDAVCLAVVISLFFRLCRSVWLLKLAIPHAQKLLKICKLCQIRIEIVKFNFLPPALCIICTILQFPPTYLFPTLSILFPVLGTKTFDKLQHPQNNLARVVCQCQGRTDARPLLWSLLWLPVRQRVIYKVALLTHQVRTTATPVYLSDLVQTHIPTWALRSSDAPLLIVPRTQTELVRRAFSVAVPYIWNFLPADIKLCESVSTFKRHWKPICSDSLSPPVLQAPLYLRISRQYTNVLLLLLVLFLWPAGISPVGTKTLERDENNELQQASW